MKKENFSNIIILALFTGILAIFTSCQQEDSIIGLNITPGSDKMQLFCDTIDVECYTVSDKNVSTDERTLASLGSYNDPVFGFTKSSFIFQTRVSSNNVDFSSVETINSLDLYLRYNSHYGDSATTQNVNIYRLLTDVYVDSTYYSDFKPDASQIELLSTSELTFQEDSMLKISLPIELAETFIDPANASNFTDNETFIDYFKGFYITTTDDLSSGGCIYSINLLEDTSRMMLSFNDSLTYEFLINTKSATINMFEHDYTNASAEIQQVVADTAQLYDFCYVQSLGGFKTKLKFPELENLFDSTNIAINKAKLMISVELGNDESTYAPPPNLTMVAILESGKYDFTTDYKVNSTNFGGAYESSDYTYSFNIPFHIQELVNGNEDYGLYMFATSNRTMPYRTVLNGNNDSDKRMKLEIYYSKY